jgi:dienelactone hydrolase
VDRRALVAALLLWGCGGSSGGGSDAPAPDAAVADAARPVADLGVRDASPPDALAPDAALRDAALPDAAAPDAAPPAPVAPASDLEPLDVEWHVAQVPHPDRGDPVASLLASGRLPCPGADTAGLQWTTLHTGPDGQLPDAPRGLMYAVACLDTPEPEGLVARADGVASVYVNGLEQPGDVYAAHDKRVPLRTQAGANLIVVQAVGGRGAPQAALARTADELWLNLDDLTVPDLVVGEDAVQWVGVPVLNLSGAPALDVTARVFGGDDFAEATLRHPSLPADAVTQVAFELHPRAPWAAPDREVPVRLRIESPSLRWSYERTLTLKTVAAGATYRRTFRSPMDGSAQYYGVVPPANFDPAQKYGLILSLHGAGVQAIGQAQAYSPKDWAFLVAATNRRPFGFDWEEWGRMDAIEVLENAQASFPTDPTRVYVTGHSMGGHGTWQIGTLFAGRFAVVGPSAGWASFYTYTGQARPTGPFARSQASSDTMAYLANLVGRAVYIIHGSADDNVPVTEARNLFAALQALGADVQYHEEPGAGHWWDGDASPGADCVDWPPLMELMRGSRVDPWPLTFTYRGPSPRVNPRSSFVTVRSVTDPEQDFEIHAEPLGADAVSLTTTNVRSLVIDGAALTAKGVVSVVVDGEAHDVPDGPLPIGPQDGKREDAHGPFNQVLQQPFCFVYPDDGPAAYRNYAALLTSTYDLIGNGYACAVPLSAVDDALRSSRNLVYLGVRPADIDEPVPFTWDGLHVTLGDRQLASAALAFVFPHHGRLGAVITATRGAEHLLSQLTFFHSGFALPDYMVWTAHGAQAAGFFDADWHDHP